MVFPRIIKLFLEIRIFGRHKSILKIPILDEYKKFLDFFFLFFGR